MLTREERIFSELLLARGLVAQDVLEACERARSGDPSSDSLADLLRERGDLGESQVAEALEEARAIHVAMEPELGPETRLGEFRLIRRIGRGAMGIVYEAEQESLRRRVAVKVLPAGAALDERLSVRFLREARAAARLDHPGIVPVHASGHAAGVLYFAMKLVEGRSLAEILAGGPVEPGTAARWTHEVAVALDHAHRGGLIHRDVKPGNILVDSDGRALLTDFGLVHDTIADSFTLSHHALGTPAYMAPECALGGAAERRGDVYGLGAVLYALLAGRAPFSGAVASLVLSKVVAEPPPRLTALNPSLPRRLVAICEKAMARVPEERYAEAAEMAADLASFLSEASPPPPRRRSWRWAWVATAAGALLVAGAAVLLGLRNRTADRPMAPSEPRFAQLSVEPGIKTGVTLSADGALLAYSVKDEHVGRSNIVLHDLRSGVRRNLTSHLPIGGWLPVFSPDGGRIAYSQLDRPQGIFVVNLSDGSIERIDDGFAVCAWAPNGREIVAAGVLDFKSIRQLRAIDLASRRSRVIRSIDAAGPVFSPHGLRIAVARGPASEGDLWTFRPDGSDGVRLTDGPEPDWDPFWIDDGRALLYASAPGGTPAIWRLGIDEASGRPTGPPSLAVPIAFASERFHASFSRGGDRMAFISEIERGRLFRLGLDVAAKRLTGPPVALPRFPSAMTCPQPSPDGSAVAYTALSPDEDLATIANGMEASPVFLTDDSFFDRSPRWSPDGGRLAFHSNRSGQFEIWTVRADGSELTQLTRTAAGPATFPVWSPDGQHVAYGVEGVGAFVTEVDGSGARMLPGTGADAASFEPSSWSSDGATLAGTGRGIALYSVRDGTIRHLTSEGEKPIWLPGDRALLYVRGREIWTIDARGGEPTMVYSAAPGGLAPCLGVSRDGAGVYVSLNASNQDVWLGTLNPTAP